MRKLPTMLVLACVSLAFSAHAAGFSLSSPDFKNNGAIPDKYTFNNMGCTGQNLSPALEWKNAPAGTKSFALMVHDPDAPTGSGWWHWVLYNIPASTTSLPEGAGKSLPAGAAEGSTDFGTTGYGGPCPPPGSGKHHYNFTLYALKVDKLDVPPNATAAMVGFYAGANSLGKAKLTGLYERKK
jgi:Raf kinase inhibitor-like YbhB/YbcL family protein